MVDRFEVRAKTTKLGKLDSLKDNLLSRLKKTFRITKDNE